MSKRARAFLVLAGGIGLTGAIIGAVLFGGFGTLIGGAIVFLGLLVYYFAADEAVR